MTHTYLKPLRMFSIGLLLAVGFVSVAMTNGRNIWEYADLAEPASPSMDVQVSLGDPS